MNTKPKILAKPKRITALEKRKQPLSWYERNEVDAWYHRRAISDEARRLFDENEKFLLEEKRRKKREKREQKERADREHRENTLREKAEKKEGRLKWAHRFVQTLSQEKDISSLPSHEIKSLSRIIGSAIRDTRPTVFIGWESAEYIRLVEEAKASGKNKPNPTKDHIYPQQFFGRFLITHFEVMGEMTREQFDRYMEVFNQVSHITFKENNVLGIQGGEDAPQHARKFLNPERAYREGGVEVDFEKYPPIKRLEDVAPRKVLQAHFGERFEEMHKYKC